jgi:hypothetical protein
MTAPWYPVTDQHPPWARFSIEVRVEWNGRHFTACRIKDDKGRIHWAEVVKKRYLPLPRGAVPRCWQPLDAERWQAPLPLPIMHQSTEGIMWSSRQSFSAVEAAEDVEPEQRQDEEAPAAQWWRDASKVRYEPPGEVTYEMAEGRIMRALNVDRLTRMEHERRGTSNAGVIADMKGHVELETKQEANRQFRPPFEPSPRDRTDHPVALGWLLDMHWTDIEFILRGRACEPPPRTWKEIGRDLERNPVWVQRRYVRLIEQAVAVANGKRTRAMMELEALRGRNLAHKRGEAA